MSQDVINCPMCDRRTPAARGACIYCGESLPFTNIAAAPPQRNIDSNELAFNAVLEPINPRMRETAVAALAASLQVETDEAEMFIGAGKPVPLARSQNRREAEMIVSLIRTCGLGARVIGDEELMIERELPRARRIAKGESELEIHHTAGVMNVPVSDIKLLVVGALKSVRVDYTESGGGLRGQSGKVLDTAEFRSDDILMDVYTTSLDRSFRVKSDAFDYSGMVWPLSFRAEVNFLALIAALRASAPQAVFDDDFARMKSLLARAWPERTRNEAQGIRRAGLAYRPVAKSSAISDNRDQFDRYSRLAFIYVVGL